MLRSLFLSWSFIKHICREVKWPLEFGSQSCRPSVSQYGLSGAQLWSTQKARDSGEGGSSGWRHEGHLWKRWKRGRLSAALGLVAGCREGVSGKGR